MSIPDAFDRRSPIECFDAKGNFCILVDAYGDITSFNLRFHNSFEPEQPSAVHDLDGSGDEGDNDEETT